jgi:hypothetical protein
MSDLNQGEGWSIAEGRKQYPPGSQSDTVPPPQVGKASSPCESPDTSPDAEAEKPSVAAPPEVHPHPEHHWHAPPPRLIRDTDLWVVGAIVLIVLIVIAVMALPSKKGLGAAPPGVSRVVLQPVSCPASAVCLAVGGDVLRLVR